MPKDRSHSYLSSGRSKPYSCKHVDQSGSKNIFPTVGDEREWEEAKCAICLEHPHNAVLLLCSSREKGCRPYMCDTSYRHSNCLDQIRKSSPCSIQTTDLSGDVSYSNNVKKLEPALPCPLCRGQISGWMIIEPARSFMNSKPRSCSLESCDFKGTYPELRRHARREHPSVCPTKADPTRLEEWTRLENDTTYEDLLTLGNETRNFMDLFPLDDYASFFQNLESDSELDEAIDLDFELELPFTFMEMPLFHSDPFCPYHTSVDLSPEWSYQPINRVFDHLTSQPDDTTRGYSSRSSNSNLVQRQQNRRS